MLLSRSTRMLPLSVIICEVCRREVLDSVQACPHCGAPPIKTRGVLSILFWAATGTLAGALIAPLIAVLRSQREKINAVVDSTTIGNGAALGAVVGICVGTFLWAFFPYKSKAPAQTGNPSSEDEPELS